jgi:HEXXH motif-containing protein
MLNFESDANGKIASFLPRSKRAEFVDKAVRARTADSLEGLGQALSSQIPERLASVDKMVSALRSGRVRPALFALYSDLVLAIEGEDESRLVATLASADALSLTARARLEAVSVTDECLGPGMAARYLGHVDDDPLVPISILPLRASELAKAERMLCEALLLIREADWQLAEEVTNLVQEVVFARSGDDAPTFGGSTTFYLWGAVFINAMEYPDPVSMAEGLVHEAAHTLLLGSTFGEPLVENDPTECFASPLRQDPRPMDGIVHACFVLARMYYLMYRLLRCGSVDREKGRLASALEQHRHDFLVGDEVVAKHARFTRIGNALYQPAREYMLSV